MSDKKVISFNEISKNNAKQTQIEIEKEKHDYLLDELEKIFPEGGVIITLNEGNIGLSACIESYETFRDVLVYSLVKVCEQGGMQDEYQDSE
jgi:hypothetical protein